MFSQSLLLYEVHINASEIIYIQSISLNGTPPNRDSRLVGTNLKERKLDKKLVSVSLGQNAQ